jgi:hypothetical protein
MEISGMVLYEAKTEAKIAAGIGVGGAALTLFAHSYPPFSLSDQLKPVILDWQAWTRGFLDIFAGLTGADLSANLKDGLMLSTFLIVMALAVKRGRPFQERAPRLLSLSFLEFFGLYMLLAGLFVVIPFDRNSGQFDSASAVQFFLLLPVFAFSATYAGRRQFFNALWVAFACIGLLFLINRL